MSQDNKVHSLSTISSCVVNDTVSDGTTIDFPWLSIASDDDLQTELKEIALDHVESVGGIKRNELQLLNTNILMRPKLRLLLMLSR